MRRNLPSDRVQTSKSCDSNRPLRINVAARRNLPYLFRSRPGLPENCPEILIVPRLLKIIFRFPRLIGAQLLEESRASSKYHFVKSTKDLESLLVSLTQTDSRDDTPHL